MSNRIAPTCPDCGRYHAPPRCSEKVPDKDKPTRGPCPRCGRLHWPHCT